MNSRKRKHTDLPARSDSSYMKLYKEKTREHRAKQRKEYRERKLLEDPEHFKKRYDANKAAQYVARNIKTVSENRWRKYGIVDMTYERYLEELEKCGSMCGIL